MRFRSMTTNGFGGSFEADRKEAFSTTESSRDGGLEGALDEMGFFDSLGPVRLDFEGDFEAGLAFRFVLAL